jgi:uroporphyrinogen decarboxylase
MNETFLDACLRKDVEYTPVWFMRQAGRYLPLYRSIKGSRSVTEFVKDPESVSELVSKTAFTLGVDAAIIYSDIVFILEPMGIDFTIVEGLGPVAKRRISSPEDVLKLASFDPEEDLFYIFDGIDKTIEKLNSSIPLIGFAGSPFTLACYSIDGMRNRTMERTRSFMYTYNDEWKKLMGRLSETVSKYLLAQIKHGVLAVQLFDSWAGLLSEEEYVRNVLPYTEKVFSSLPSNVPKIYFCENSSHLLRSFCTLSAEVLSVDWRTKINLVWKYSREKKAAQGNLDPVLAEVGGQVMIKAVEKILEDASNYNGHIFNLGHGVLPGTDPNNLRRIVREVHNRTRRRK